ncbi:hypothetical protein ABIE78_001233 [Sinorhizobium fredii]|uniref:Uncharacterized protein n=1 Tax=Sinorhizobium fredii (strain USDA 257) TaxID=1185652 RepID=I3XAH0_SINF2|nr:hypothetical protein [Sinorhizobium fredii]AFL52876.1 hypothetical protein USDA257_c43370 [Sinorhizobium fredii USDA 257]
MKVEENWQRIEATRIVNRWIREGEAAALKGDFGPDWLVQLGGTLIERGKMGAETCRMRLAHIADDARPERDAERAWLVERIEQELRQ